MSLPARDGRPIAILAGHDHAKGSCVITLPADGQEPVQARWPEANLD